MLMTFSRPSLKPLLGARAAGAGTAVLLLIALTGIPSFGAGGQRYFPLTQGMKWTYLATESGVGRQAAVGRLRFTDLAPRTFKGQTLTPQAARSR